jgi:hypothetical protein
MSGAASIALARAEDADVAVAGFGGHPPVIEGSEPPWTANARVDDDSAGGEQNEPSIASPSPDAWYAGWNDLRPFGGSYGCGFARTSDGGATWKPNAKMSDAAGAVYRYLGDYTGLAAVALGLLALAASGRKRMCGLCVNRHRRGAACSVGAWW